MSLISPFTLARFCSAAIVFVPSMIFAASVDWDNGAAPDNNWNTPANWSTDVVPVAPDDAVFINPALGPAVINANLVANPRDIRFGDEDPDGAGPLTARVGSGVVNHTAGTANIGGWFRMGITGGSGGTYNLSGNADGTGSLLTAGRFNIAESGGTTGTLAITGGTLRQNDVANPMDGNNWSRIGQDGNATMNISGGLASFDSARLIIGNGASSTNVVTQTGGIVEARRGTILIADGSPDTTYNISGGTLRTVTRAFDPATPTTQANNFQDPNISLGAWDNSHGKLNVSGTATVAIAASLNMGFGRANTGGPTPVLTPNRGTVTQSGGTVTFGSNVTVTEMRGTPAVPTVVTRSIGRLLMANNSSATAEYTMTGGTLRQNDMNDRGDQASWNVLGDQGVANFNISGSSLVSLDARTMIGGGGSGNGTINQTGGTFEIRRHELIIGDTGRGTFNISAGTLRTLDGGFDIVVGHWDNSQGALNVSGTGQVVTARNLIVGNGNSSAGTPPTATGAMTQSGGRVTVANELIIANDDIAVGSYNLSGGTLDMTNGPIRKGAGNGTFTFTGGRIENASSINMGGPFSQSGGVLAPGAGTGSTVVGITIVEGNYTLSLPGTLEIAASAATGADLLDINGTVTLGGNLDLIVNTAGIPVGTQVTIIDNDGTVDPVVGTFAGRADDVPFSEDGFQYAVNYNGGDGNDVVVTFQGVPEPSTIAMMLLGFGTYGLLARRRRF